MSGILIPAAAPSVIPAAQERNKEDRIKKKRRNAAILVSEGDSVDALSHRALYSR